MKTLRKKLAVFLLTLAMAIIPAFTALAADKPPTGPALEALLRQQMARNSSATITASGEEPAEDDTAADSTTFGTYTNIPSGFTQMEGTPLCFYAGTPDSVKQQMLNAFLSLPDNTRKMAAVSNFHYLITDKAHAGSVPNFQNPGTLPAGETMRFAYYYYSDGSIAHTDFAAVIFYDTEGTTPDLTLIHETGHMMDDCMLMYRGDLSSTTDEFTALAARYKNVIGSFDRNSAVNVYTSSEIFAESFRIYMISPDWLSDNCPEIYNYVQNVIENLPTDGKVTY
jgi:hypothetical protein